eukprot:TRINITY_DN3449_c0_g1_i1.p1 TRINITY_DN3449_c0_g1~~TRINITY_DN3449_c0_g1_i1.p1  ORF type:complete len:338 (+),score=109.80 TRINITY_DN3449_c0_g1_i1:381-1394(+)
MKRGPEDVVDSSENEQAKRLKENENQSPAQAAPRPNYNLYAQSSVQNKTGEMGYQPQSGAQSQSQYQRPQSNLSGQAATTNSDSTSGQQATGFRQGFPSTSYTSATSGSGGGGVQRNADIASRPNYPSGSVPNAQSNPYGMVRPPNNNYIPGQRPPFGGQAGGQAKTAPPYGANAQNRVAPGGKPGVPGNLPPYGQASKPAQPGMAGRPAHQSSGQKSLVGKRVKVNYTDGPYFGTVKTLDEETRECMIDWDDGSTSSVVLKVEDETEDESNDDRWSVVEGSVKPNSRVASQKPQQKRKPQKKYDPDDDDEDYQADGNDDGDDDEEEDDGGDDNADY